MTQGYISAEDAVRHAQQRGLDSFDGIENDRLEKLLLRASDWIDGYFDFAGEKVRADQPRAFPRRFITSAPDAGDGLPDRLVQAVIELTSALLVSDHEAETLLGIRGTVSREQIGDIAISYHKGRQAPRSRIRLLLAPYLKGVSATRINRQ